MVGTKTPRNLILASLPDRDLILLNKDLIPLPMPRGMDVEQADRRIANVYFPETGFISIVDDIGADRSAEVGLVGREGMSGLAIVFGEERSAYGAYVQLPGTCQRLPAAKLRAAMEKSPALRQALMRYAHRFLGQAAHTASTNARASLDERLARWLLMAHDRVDGDEIALTHECLSLMLGVRRAGVTDALAVMSRRGLIGYRRGVITMLDREGMQRRAKGAYGKAERKMLI